MPNPKYIGLFSFPPLSLTSFISLTYLPKVGMAIQNIWNLNIRKKGIKYRYKKNNHCNLVILQTICIGQKSSSCTFSK